MEDNYQYSYVPGSDTLSCKRCGALVVRIKVHNLWHEGRFDEIEQLNLGQKSSNTP